jgi:radical SAM protein with 4Fe4S-binding SPASM domain
MKKVFIETTSSCNHDCKYCYFYGYEHQEKGLYISKATINKICERFEIEYNDTVSVVLSGGEPFVNRERLYYFINKLKKTPNVTEININTNLTLINEEDVKILKDITLFFSLVSLNKKIYEQTTKGDYDLFISKLKMAVANNLNLVANIVVNSLNIDDVNKTVTKAKMLGIKKISLVYVSYNKLSSNRDLVDLDKQQMRKYLEISKTLSDKYEGVVYFSLMQPCSFQIDNVCFNCGCCGDGTYCIGVDGSIKPCETSTFNKKFGTVFDEGTLNDLVNEMKQYKLNNTEQLPTACRECSMVQLCYGGCGQVTKRPNEEMNYEQFKMFCNLTKNNKLLSDNTNYIINNFLPPWELTKYYKGK